MIVCRSERAGLVCRACRGSKGSAEGISGDQMRLVELAAGWNAGAQKPGVKLPAWVARHGSKRSSAAVINTFRVFRIILTNAVKYVTNVESYDRRIQSAINIQGKKMQRRGEFLLARACFCFALA